MKLYASLVQGYRLPQFALIVLVASALSTHAATISYDFSSESQYTDNFTFVGTGGASGVINWSSSPGVGGTAGRVDFAVTAGGNSSMIYTNDTFDLNAGPITVSYFFLGSAYTNTNVSRVALGLSYDQTSFVTQQRGESRLIKNGLTSATFEVRSSTGGTSTSGLTLVSNDWYQISTTYQLSSTTNGLDITSSISNFGSTGEGTPTLLGTATGTYVNPNFFTSFGSGVALPLYLGIELQNNGGGGIALDNVNIVTVPEPGSLWMMGFGAIGLLLWHNRRPLLHK